MKKIILILSFLSIFVFIKTKAQQEPVIDFNYFYSALLPLGEWIQLSQDLVVWHPNVLVQIGVLIHWDIGV